MTGLTRSAFEELVRLVSPLRHRTRGRPRLLSAADELGLLLLYVNSKMYYKQLSMIFGVVPSTVSTTINEMLSVLKKKLVRHRAAAIKFPGAEEMRNYARMVNLREPEVDNVIGFVDGLAIYCECCDDPFQQNAQYNGYHHDTTVNNVFAFAPTGKVIFACINFPGT